MAKVPIIPVPRTGKYISMTPVERTGKYVSINPFENEVRETASNIASVNETNLIVIPFGTEVEYDLTNPPFNANDPDLYNKEGSPPLWKGLWGGETYLIFGYKTDQNRILNITIGNNETGTIYIEKILCAAPEGTIKIILAKIVDPNLNIPFYNQKLWENVENAGDAIRHVTFKGEEEKPIELTYFNLTFNGNYLVDNHFTPSLPIIKSEPIYIDDAMSNHGLKRISYNLNSYLRCAVGEYGSSHNYKYEKSRFEWDGKNGIWVPPEWCGEFLCWVLETVDPIRFYNLWDNTEHCYVRNYFKPNNLYISPYAEINKIPYRGNIYPDFYQYLGSLVKPGFLASTKIHITMFLSWCDKYGDPRPFISDKNKGPNYFLGLGGSQNNKVAINIFSINYFDDGVSNIIWYRKNATGKRICAEDDDPPNDEGFSDTRQ